MTQLNKITFCINTARNELDNIKLLFKSLQVNLSTLEHEIIVFIDSDNENTLDWLITQKQIFPNLKIFYNHLDICWGYARNINEMFLKASNDIVTYLQSDMVVCKNYDLEILKHLKPDMILCSTRIEPPLHPQSGEKHTFDFGLDPNVFKLDEFTQYAESIKQEKITEYFFAPFTLYKNVWNNIGGHDTTFRRSREDSDILTRLLLNNTKIIQVWNALVYHFTCTSSRGKNWFDKNNKQAQERVQIQQIADQIELNRFFRKWGKFNHNINKIPYYNISAKITGTNQQIFEAIEPFFNKIEVNDVVIQNFLTKQTQIHNPANTLLNISQDNWLKYNYMYKQENLESKFGDVNNDNIIIEFNLDNINQSNFQEFIVQLQDIIHTIEEPGDYEFDVFKIKINKLENIASSKIIVNNPIIKEQDMYQIF